MRYLLLALFVACATPEARSCPDVKCPPCQRDTACELCVKICGDAGVRRCETYGSAEKSCECKGF